MEQTNARVITWEDFQVHIVAFLLYGFVLVAGFSTAEFFLKFETGG